MKQCVVLSLQGKQHYPEQEPETIELTTEGFLEERDGGWDLCYEETELTGLAGVTTTFRIVPGCVTLTRTGKLRSQMIFQLGVRHDSLYQMDFGTLMMSICATRVEYHITPAGGTMDLTYQIEIEQTTAGTVEYHLDIRAK